jgi:hypothetical protein
MTEYLRSIQRSAAGALGASGTLRATRVLDRVQRMTYDLSGEGRRSIAAIRERRDSGRGSRCFIIGNGPSLARMDLELLRGEVTFGLNRAYLLFDSLGFATTYLVAVNQLVIEQSGRDILNVGVPTFMSWRGRKWVKGSRAPIFLPTSRAREFSHDPSRAVWEGSTVTFVAMQIAHYMGFDPVILIGVDHSFSTKGRAHQEVVSTGPDPNHFDPSYFGKGFRWNLPDLETSEIAYRMAKAAFAADERQILDATLEGSLGIFPKVDYGGLFSAQPHLD